MAYRDSTSATGSSTTPSTTVPAGVQVGDIVILYFTYDNSSAVVQAGDIPTGFTELLNLDCTADGSTNWLGWKRLTAEDSGSYTFGNITNSSEWICQAFAFSGRHATDAPTGTQLADNTLNNTPQSIGATGVTAVEGDDLLWVGAPDVDATGAGTGFTEPSTYTMPETAENGFCNLAGAYKENVSAGSTGTITGSFTHSNLAGWVAFLVRIPAAAAGRTTKNTRAFPLGMEIGMGWVLPNQV